MGEAGVRRAALLALAIGLAACAPSYPMRPETGSAAPTIEAPSLAPSPPPMPQPRSPIPRPETAERDQCGAADLQRLVGKLRTEIPVPLDPRRQRVACTTCPVTEDFSPLRLNFFFDAETGRIKQIRCG